MADEEDEEESWAQTLITVTPEDNAVVRTITNETIVSSSHEDSLTLDAANISYRQTIVTIRQDFVDVDELEEKTYLDTDCQTYIQGFPEVELPERYKDEATQTMFMGRACPSLPPFQDIINRMNDNGMPIEKNTRATQTLVTFSPSVPRNEVIERLLVERIADDTIDLSSLEDSEGAVLDNLYYILARVFWLSDPGRDSRNPNADNELNDAEVQTLIKYDEKQRRLFFDTETQTNLTCEPKLSNTRLLENYEANKMMTMDILEECLQNGLRSRLIVDSVIEELMDKCVEHVRFPLREIAVQTLARCKALEDKDDEVLRKLRLPLVTDSLEPSIIILPLISQIVEDACIAVRERAPSVVAVIVNEVLRKATYTALRLEQIRSEAVSKPMDYIFAARRKRLEESMRKNVTTNRTTQTGLAGVPDIGRLSEMKETICSTCIERSNCYICNSTSHEVQKPQEVTKALRTRDILMTYNPCYIVATSSDQAKNPALISPCKIKVDIPAKMKRSKVSTTSSRSTSSTQEMWTTKGRYTEVCPPRKKRKNSSSRDSLNDWTKAVDTVTSRVWTLPEFTTAESIWQSDPNLDESNKSEKLKESTLFSHSLKALNILKSVFRVDESYHGSGTISNDEQNSKEEMLAQPGQGDDDDEISASNIEDVMHRIVAVVGKGHSCCTCDSTHATDKSERRSNRRDSKLSGKSGSDGLRIIPIIESRNGRK